MHNVAYQGGPQNKTKIKILKIKTHKTKLSHKSKRYESEENEADFPRVIAKCEQRDSDVREDEVLHQEIDQFTQLQQQMTYDRALYSSLSNDDDDDDDDHDDDDDDATDTTTNDTQRFIRYVKHANSTAVLSTNAKHIQVDRVDNNELRRKLTTARVGTQRQWNWLGHMLRTLLNKHHSGHHKAIEQNRQ